MSWLIDTNVLSEPGKLRPDANAVAWLYAQNQDDLFISVLTLGEIQRGALRLPPSRRRDALLHWLHFDVRRRFAGRTLPVDEAVALRWGELVATTRSLPTSDSLLAATALTHDFTIATRNTADFADSGARVFNPWEYDPLKP